MNDYLPINAQYHTGEGYCKLPGKDTPVMLSESECKKKKGTWSPRHLFLGTFGRFLLPPVPTPIPPGSPPGPGPGVNVTPNPGGIPTAAPEGSGGGHSQTGPTGAGVMSNAFDRLAQFAKGDYKTKNNTEVRRKCVQCDKGFVGRSDQKTCSDACKMAKSRSS